MPVGTRLLVVGEPEAGASALVRVLAGLSRPNHGRIEIAGLSDPSRAGFGRRAAFLGAEPGIHSWMTPREALVLADRLLELDAADADERIDRALAGAGIPSGASDRSVGRGGPPILQRTGLAAALLGDPEVLLLDEPLRALEAEDRADLLDLPGDRRTVVIASRYPAADAGLASHVALVRGGRIALVAPVGDIDAAGLSLSLRGIAELADRRAGADGAYEPEPVAMAR